MPLAKNQTRETPGRTRRGRIQPSPNPLDFTHIIASIVELFGAGGNVWCYGAAEQCLWEDGATTDCRAGPEHGVGPCGTRPRRLDGKAAAARRPGPCESNYGRTLIFMMLSPELRRRDGVEFQAPDAPLSTSQRHRTVVQESFGFDFAEDQAENTDLTILGETAAQGGVHPVLQADRDRFGGQAVPRLPGGPGEEAAERHRQLRTVAVFGRPGLGLGDVEKLLPVIDKAGVLGLVRKNLPLAIIATGYILIEPAPFLLPVLGALLAVPSGIWTAVAAVTTAAEIYLTAFASFDDSGVVALLLAPLLLIAGALSLVPAAIGAVKALPPV